MDDRLKRELIATGIPALGIPLFRAAVNNHYTMKQIDRQEEMAVKVAERRADGLRSIAGGTTTHAPATVTEPQLDNPGQVYDELAALKRETDCSFCRDAADSLLDAPPDDARMGLAEIQSYQRQIERMQDREIEKQEAERIVGDLVEEWSVVPKYVVGMA